MLKEIKYHCPDCNGIVKFWSDLNVDIECEVTATGNLKKRIVNAENNGEFRWGIQCKSCEWEQIADDKGFEIPLKIFFESIEGVELAVKRNKNC
jgi:ribosomal protein S27E